MSLLGNLLAFSSLNILSPEREGRSSSANSKFLFQSDDSTDKFESKQRVQSKSLSKMGLISNINYNKIDPKYRCLHRMTHNFSMKVRKHYYAFFVTLETMKKKNQSLNKINKYNKQKLQSTIGKISQTFSIRFLKEYENIYKGKCFKKIKIFSVKIQLAKITEKIYIKNKYRQLGEKLLSHFKDIQKVEIKVDLMKSAIHNISNQYNQAHLKHFIDSLKLIKTQPKPKQISIFELFDRIANKQTLNCNTLQQENSQSRHNEKRKEEIKLQNISKLQPFRKNWSCDLQNGDKQRKNSVDYAFTKSLVRTTSYESRSNSLQASPLHQINSKSKSLYTSYRKVLNLRESVVRETLQAKTYQKMYKSYQVQMNYIESPFELDSKREIVPKKLHKMNPQQLGFAQVEDLADKSNIFREFKGSKVSEFENLEISNVVGDPFNKDNRERYQKSEISYNPYLPYENSLSTINHKDQSCFGCEAVNFKNSLVQQRESMKKTGRQKVQIYSNSKPKIKVKNDSSERRIMNTVYTNYEPTYKLQLQYQQPDRRRESEPYSLLRNTNSLNNGGYTYDLDIKRFQNSYNGTNQSKSYSNFIENIANRIPYENQEVFNRKSIHVIPQPSSIVNFNTKESYFRAEMINNRAQMPVRDVGLDPIVKMKMKSNSFLKQQPFSGKKFINISKR